MKNENRKIFDETVSAMFTNPLYNDYLFYASALSRLEVEFVDSDDSDFPAAVYFCKRRLNYVIIINSTFNNYSLVKRLGIIKHEISHIIWGHLSEIKDRNLKKWNIATDCSINQFIEESHLIDGAILPSTLDLPEKLTSYEYYNLIEDEAEATEDTSNHSHWDSDIPVEIQSDVASNIIESASEFTIKHKGKLPKDISKMIEIHQKAKMNWKTALKKFMHIKAGKRSTFKRKNRRFPENLQVRGHIKEFKTNVTVLMDVSGSVSDNDLTAPLSELIKISKIQNLPIDLIQIDSEPRPIEILTSRTKFIKRVGEGGTYLSRALELIKKKTLLIIITDGYLEDDDVQNFNDSKFKILWMITGNGEPHKNMKNFIKF